MKYSDLNLKTYDETINLKEYGLDVNVLHYLPITEKDSLIHYVLQNSFENGYYNPLLVSLYFELGLVLMYSDFEFTDEEKADGAKLYDELKSNGIISAIIGAIPEQEYKILDSNLRLMIANSEAYNKSFAGTVTTYLETLPKNIEQAMAIAKQFNPEDFKMVMDFAKAANGDREIN